MLNNDLTQKADLILYIMSDVQSDSKDTIYDFGFYFWIFCFFNLYFKLSLLHNWNDGLQSSVGIIIREVLSRKQSDFMEKISVI